MGIVVLAVLNKMRYLHCIILAFVVLMHSTCKKGGASPSPSPRPQPPASQGTRLSADGPGNTYELIASVLGGNPLEDPDCAHTDFGRHISETFDGELNKPVFIFFMHLSPDN